MPQPVPLRHSFGKTGSQSSRHRPTPCTLLLALIWPLSLLLGEQEEADPVHATLARAQDAISRGEHEAAARLYHEALQLVSDKVAVEELNETQALEARVYIFDAMANLSLSTMQLELAETLFKETMKGFIQLGKETNHDALVEISLKLAMIYAMQARNDEAETGYTFCVKTQRLKLESDTYETAEDTQNGQALLGMALNSYARFLMVNSRFVDSVQMFERALVQAVTVYGSESHHVALLHNDLAAVAGLQDNTELAVKHLTKAIEIAEKVQSQELCLFYLNYGEILLQQKQIKEARENFRKSFRLAKVTEYTEVYTAAKKAWDDSVEAAS